MDIHRKILHENFTSFVGTTSLTEVLALCTIPIPLLSIRHILTSLFGLKLRNLIINLLWDALCVIVPTILLLTVANQHILLVWTSTSVSVFFWQLLALRPQSNRPPLTFASLVRVADLKCVVMLLTCLMLLGIDMPVCPRRFAKTHTRGFSLMDTGTGLAISLSAVSAYQYVLSPAGVPSSLGYLLQRSVLPAFVIGSTRVCLVSLLNYQQPTAEYGSHWNFFYTFAFVRLISCTVLSSELFTNRYSLTKRLFCLIGITVSLFSLSWYLEQRISLILTEDVDWPSVEARSRSLLLANAEGLLSLSGYTAIYFCGILYFTFSRLLFDHDIFTRTIGSFLTYTLFSLFLIVFCYAYLDHFGWYSISRRFANSGYIVFIFLATVVSVLFNSLSAFTQYYCGGTSECPPSALILCTSKFGMVYFLLSNVITGGVNFFVDTLSFLSSNAVIDPNTGVYSLSFQSTAVQLVI
ncbi:phosphatidylinositol glycan class W, partial [Clonorchis sinensis]